VEGVLAVAPDCAVAGLLGAGDGASVELGACTGEDAAGTGAGVELGLEGACAGAEFVAAVAGGLLGEGPGDWLFPGASIRRGPCKLNTSKGTIAPSSEAGRISSWVWPASTTLATTVTRTNIHASSRRHTPELAMLTILL
jgi:hypothetical protein